MNADNTPSDSLDKRLASQPVTPKADFTERTLMRIREEVDAPMDTDAQLESWLEAQPVSPSVDFTQHTLEAIRQSAPEQSDRRLLGMPVWALTLGGMAAALAIGALAFQALFQHAYDQGAVVVSTLPDGVVGQSADSSTDPVSNIDDTRMVAKVTVEDTSLPATPVDMLLADSDTAEAAYADVLILQDAFAEIDDLSDADTMETLIAFVN